MKIELKEKEICFDQNHDFDLFDFVFKEISKNYETKVLKELDGLDQRYWDLLINGSKFTLHYENYLGVSLSISGVKNLMPNNKRKALSMLEEIYNVFKIHELYS